MSLRLLVNSPPSAPTLSLTGNAQSQSHARRTSVSQNPTVRNLLLIGLSVDDRINGCGSRHTVIKLTPKAYGCDEERFVLPIEAVDTSRFVLLLPLYVPRRELTL